MSGTGRPARTRLPAADRRRQIVRVATELFRDRPFHEISLEEIAERAGVTRPLITHHFGSKRKLYIAVVTRVLDVGTLPVPPYIHGLTLRDRLELSVDEWLENIDRNRELWLHSIRMMGSGDPEIVEVVEAAREHVALRVAQLIGVEHPDGLGDRAMATLRIWAGISEAATVQWLVYSRLTRQETGEIMTEALERVAADLLT